MELSSLGVDIESQDAAMETFMKRFITQASLLLLALISFSCSSGDSEREAKAVSLVQNSQTAIQGRTTLQLLTDLAITSKAMGNSIKPLGWAGIAETGDNIKVIFKIEENGKLLQYEWLVNGNNISPGNQLARDLSTIGKE